MNIKWIGVSLSLFLNNAMAQMPIVTPQPTTCISANFSATGTNSWKTVYLQLTNNCDQGVDFQNSSITFTTASTLHNADFWGVFSPLSYPVNALKIASQIQSDKTYLDSLTLQFPNYTGSNSILPKGNSFTLIYGAPQADYVASSVRVYVSSPIATGTINLMNNTAKPTNISQGYATVKLTANNQTVSTVQVPWSGQQAVTGLAAGTYGISPVSITDSAGIVYQGAANPSSINLTANSTVSSSITYTAQPASKGAINIKLSALPNQLSGYTAVPTVTLTRADNNSASSVSVAWNNTTTVSQLANGINYSFATPAISYNGYNCTPTFTPNSATATTSAPTVQLAYSCTQVTADTVSVQITGAPSTTSSINVTFTPTGNANAITQAISLTNGTGEGTVQLTDGAVYTVSANPLSGYTVSFSPQPLTASANATEVITYTPSTTSTGGRIIAYLPGWKTPPPANALANAGYTHVLVAFGVFSTSAPGQITSAFDTVTKAYIQSLQSVGIKVLLSLGGASTSVANTTVNFHQVLSSASSATVFEQTFISSLESLITQYGFDGFDFDIESGLNAGGSFAAPTGDIAVLANIINTMHANHPGLLLTLAPQIANISATSGFDATWGNYASLVMQTYQSLEWVGIQMYNAGCAYGIDLICYDPNNTSSPNTSVAMATDLLANWPATTNSGQRTGFQPYISHLKPSQVVLGYPAPNASGSSDGQPAAVISTIKRAIQCLRTGVVSSSSCDTYVPPATYPGFGGVFEWEVTYDEANNYNFATSLVNCITKGNCN